MTAKPIDWLDIALHTAIAALWAGMAGYAAALGLAYGGVLGTLMAVLGVLAGLAGLLFWVLRERLQHDWGWGGPQSHLEWIFPDVAGVICFGAGMAIPA